MTTEWPGVVWTETQQVFLLLGWPSGPAAGAAPADFLAELRASVRPVEAVQFLAMALPRYEAVLWAAGTVRNDDEAPDATVMRAVDAWLRDPSDANRRAARAAANAHRSATPERMCAMAAFMSGGSIAAEGQPCHQPPREATGRFAAMAVIAVASAAMRAAGADNGPVSILARRQAVLDRALDAGLRFAEYKDREVA